MKAVAATVGVVNLGLTVLFGVLLVNTQTPSAGVGYSAS